MTMVDNGKMSQNVQCPSLSKSLCICTHLCPFAVRGCLTTEWPATRPWQHEPHDLNVCLAEPRRCRNLQPTETHPRKCKLYESSDIGLTPFGQVIGAGTRPAANATRAEMAWTCARCQACRGQTAPQRQASTWRRSSSPTTMGD